MYLKSGAVLTGRPAGLRPSADPCAPPGLLLRLPGGGRRALSAAELDGFSPAPEALLSGPL